VDVNFGNAPHGMRAEIASADGPSDFGLRVEHAANTL
jgi:hypothetical protein